MRKKTLVLGASKNPHRYAYMAIRRLLEAGHAVVALGKSGGEVKGIPIFSGPIPIEKVDTVTLYLNPLNQKKYYDYLISLHPKRVIFNPGTENPELYELLRKEGIAVEVACTLVLLSTDQY
ncbi:MAG TPA: CoA-binding protein [Flavobacteriaceae bacterium]|nr:CoA-binding protein [Flavobacteriaceae bacterium]HPF11622.1 CoA-binding protein [Flavobacteriaceae bacterium]HQU20097.1 CoA-binding protein [Flavobacteriaceae bacterium]HQU64814.1 CoA-binding protein [Flavobacteriaceae bacterium]HRW43476.1 CoA-binding protein [Flavobacteriaceae bacterium]